VIAETVKVIDLSGQRRKHEQVNTKWGSLGGSRSGYEQAIQNKVDDL
jgi:hypothetical protein